MNQSSNNPIEVKYDGIKNITYEFLEKGVIYANIGNPNLTVSDTIISITPMRYYEGKVLNDSAKIGFRITITGPREFASNFYYHIEKIVIVCDEERIEVDFGEKGSENAKEYAFSQTEIVGLNKTNVLSHVKYKHEWDDGWKDFVLQPADIKRIAEAHEAGMYIDAFTLVDANGGTINFRDGGGSFQIEGIQGAMKRAYHYFVDVTSYIDYCSSFKIKQQKVLEEEKQRIEQEKERIEQENQIKEQQRIQQYKEQRAAEKLWYQAKRKYKIMMIISIALFILCIIIGDSGFTFFLGMVSVVLFFYSMIRIMILNGALDGDGDDGNDNYEG